ncbi:MAG TPA: Gfo/Idh/MocA family oxidoreductase, partial [bacterium]|nr:Gfo/Idh/MocA family oxidoreductase [bacterium]
MLRLFIIGAGSIGQRHLRNALQLGGVECAVAEPDPQRREMVAATFSVPVFQDLEQGIAWRPQVALVCTPSHAHLEPSLRCASEGIHLFIEKPISHSLDGLGELKQLVEKNDLICVVGYNLRFHPGMQAVKRILEEERIGQPWFAEIEYGHYLPFWRPDQDYRKTYSAHRDMGGGAILDLIHEFDYAQWFFGRGTLITAAGGKRSNLELDCE